MNAIKDIELQLDAARALLEENLSQVDREPDNFAYQLALSSMQAHVDDLQEQLREAKLEREKEVVELRFKGRKAEMGTLPLHLVGDLMKTLAEALHESSYYILRGRRRTGGRIPSDIYYLTDLRLADIRPGSTRVYITGTLKPDLFGNSLLESTLNGAFQILRAGSPDELADAVSEVGLNGAKKLGVFLDDLRENELELEVNWETPQDEVIHWNGDHRAISELSSSLQRIDVTRDEVWMRVTIVTLSLKGRAELRGLDGRTFACTYPLSIYETVRQFHIGDEVDARIEVSTYLNLTTGAQRERFKLLTMRDPDKFREAGITY